MKELADRLVREVWRKQCDCGAGATASGPRFVLSVVGDGTVRFRRVRFACDECDTPWSTEVERSEAT